MGNCIIISYIPLGVGVAELQHGNIHQAGFLMEIKQYENKRHSLIYSPPEYTFFHACMYVCVPVLL